MDTENCAQSSGSHGPLAHVNQTGFNRAQHHLRIGLWIGWSTWQAPERLPSTILHTENNGVAGAEKIGCVLREESVVRTAPDESGWPMLFFVRLLIDRLLYFSDVAGGVMEPGRRA
jgi:hypothetical protein